MYTRQERSSCRNALRHECGGKLLRIKDSSQILREKQVCETIGPFDSELSTEFHVFLDSVLCLGKQTTCQKSSSTKGGTSIPRYSRNPRGELMENKFNSDATYFLVPNRTRQCSKSMNGFDKVTEMMDKHFTPGTCPHRVIFTGMMKEIPISSKGPKARNALLLQDAENAAYFGKFKPGYYMYSGPGSQETWNFEKYPDNPRGKWDELAQQVTDVYLVQKHPIFARMHSFPKRSIEARWWKHALRRQWPVFQDDDGSHQFSQWHLNSWRNLSIFFGRINKNDLESRQNTTSVVLTPRVSEIVTLSEGSAADNLSNHSWIAEQNLSARTSTVESIWLLAVRKRQRETSS